MASQPPAEPISDSITKVNDEVAVGSDLQFQRRWWRFERAIWIVFVFIVILDALGVFGRGWFANAERRTSDGSMDIKYERVERFRTPSVLAIHFGPNAIHDGKVQLWASDSLIRSLGVQRVLPQPARSAIGEGGILYVVPATAGPASIEFALEPSSPGVCHLTFRVPGSDALTLAITVMP